MAVIETWYNQDLKQPVKVHYLDGNVFSQDNGGNLVGVDVLDGDDPATLSGTVSASVIRADGATVAVSGARSGNQCSVTLPQSCYSVPGLLSIVIKLTSGSTITTVCAVVANVYRSSTDTVVDPGTIIPDISTLVQEIETAVASIPADYSDLWESLAPNFSTSTSYKIGQYCTYDGGLYRFTSNHSGSWNSSHVAPVSIGTDLSALRGTLFDDARMTAEGYSTFIELPPGQYLFSITTAGAYGFPAGLGKSFYVNVSVKAYASASSYAFKSFLAYGNGKTAFFTMAGGSSSPSNLPAWNEIIHTKSPIIAGNELNDTALTAYGTFLSVPMGCYFVYMNTAGSYGFNAALGQSFYLEVSGEKSDGSYKTFRAYGNNSIAMYAVSSASSSASNLPKWVLMSNGKGGLDTTSMTAAGYTNFVDIPTGNYEIYLSEAGTFGFPVSIGQSFVLEVSYKKHSNYAYVTWTAYGNNGTAIYAVGGNSTSTQNPPAWYFLTSKNGGSSAGGVNKFSDALSTVKLLLLGDSITQGAGATTLSDPVTLTIDGLTGSPKTIYQNGSSWAGQIKAYIESQYPNVTVLNHGWGGISLGQMAAHMSDLVPNDTTHCIIGLGVNSEGQTSFDGSISTIINYLLDKGIKVFAWTSWVGSHADLSNINTAGRVQAALIHAYRNVGIEPLCVYSIAKRYIDEHELTPTQYMQPDSLVHPNDLGHTIIFRIIREGFGF